jgi:hypothetical protein
MSESRKVLEFVFAGPLFSIFSKLNAIERNQSRMATQADVDALTARVNAIATQQNKALDEVKAEVKALQDANPALDLTALSGAVDSAAQGAQALDDLNPDAPVDVPPPDDGSGDTTPPVDTGGDTGDTGDTGDGSVPPEQA